MPLLSKMLKSDSRLQACLVQDASHVTHGMKGPFVNRIQDALFVIDGLSVERNEQVALDYGPSTAAAVLDFKTRRNIVNPEYQSRPDNIVGKMTIAALDRELLMKESVRPYTPHYCGSDACRNGPVMYSAPSTRPLMQNVSFTSGVVLTQATTPTTSSPATVAKSRAPGALRLVNIARARLDAMVDMRNHPRLPQNQGLLASFDALWRNFGMPNFPKNSPLLTNPNNSAVQKLDDYLNVVHSVLDGIATNLGNAATIFRDVPRPWYESAHAFTVAMSRAPKDPPAGEFPDGIYFNPRYLNDGPAKVGPFKQMEVALHECGHLVQNDNIADPAFQTLSSAHGYSNFVLFCAIGREDIADNE